jgi:hypothetical protein
LLVDCQQKILKLLDEKQDMLDHADALEGKLKLAEAEAKSAQDASKGKDRESQDALKTLRTELKS